MDVNKIIEVLIEITESYVNLAADYGWNANKSPKVIRAKQLIKELQQKAGQKGLFERRKNGMQ